MPSPDQIETPLARALRERKELQERIRSDAQRLEKLEQIISWLREGTIKQESVDKGATHAELVSPGAPSSQEAFVMMVRALLLEIGRPMESTEIIEIFEKRGHPLGRSNVMKQTWNKLWLAKRAGALTHESKLGYWLPGEPLTDAAREKAAEARATRFKQHPPRRKGGTPRPWTGKPKGRPRSLSPELLKMAERLLLEGKSGRVVAETLGVSPPTVGYYFKGGAAALRKKASETAVDHLSETQAETECVRLAAELAQHDKRYYQEDSPTISDAEYDKLRERLRAIEAQFPHLTNVSLSRELEQ